MKKILFTSAILLLATYFSFAQVDLGLPGATGMGGVANGIVKDWECIGVNPANLGWKSNHRFSMSALIFGISVQSSALDYSQLKAAMLHPADTFSTANKSNFASLFSGKDGLNMQANLNWLTFSFVVPKVGGFAMNLRDRTYGNVTLNKNASDILFLGINAPIFQDTAALRTQDISTVFDGSKVSYMHYREMNISYGRKIFSFGGIMDSNAVSIYGGIGFKYLWGLGNFQMIADNGVLTGHSSFSSQYGINYGNVQNFTPQTSAGLFPSVGNGSALDLGIGVGVGKIKFAFSATDLGKITWNKNVLTAQDTLLPDTSRFNYAGINSWDLSKQAKNLFNDSGLVKFKPGSSYSTKLPAKFRMGVGYQIAKRLALGADLVMPLNNDPTNLKNAYFAIGTKIELASNLRICFGVAGNSTYGVSVPAGITFGHFFRVLELGIATNDLLTYINHGSNPNISFAMALFRFNVR
ncbi:MAG: hypothetical protein HY840_09220 [Bacteroidetes bacterium]|nr:hypothetical protein [Bacteroidota bacterium]